MCKRIKTGYCPDVNTYASVNFSKCLLGCWTRHKWVTRKAEAEAGTSAGCGRPGQGDYGWKGPAFNCCFGTVACLVEHKRPVRHASVAWTCEYLPDQWNVPLSSRLPYKPRYLLHFQLFQPWFYSPGGVRKTCIHICAISTGTASWGRFNNICKWDSLAVLVLFWSSSIIRVIEWLFQRNVSSNRALFSAFPDKSEQAAPIMYHVVCHHVVWTYKYILND